MTKFVCVKSIAYSEFSPKVGDVIEGELIQVHGGRGFRHRVLISKDSDRKMPDGKPYFSLGETVPLEGSVWTWKEVK